MWPKEPKRDIKAGQPLANLGMKVMCIPLPTCSKQLSSWVGSFVCENTHVGVLAL